MENSHTARPGSRLALPQGRQVLYSKEDLVDPLQIGWIVFQEGNLILRAKVIRGKNDPFLSLPSVHRKGVTVKVVDYLSPASWLEKSMILLRGFKEFCGEDYYENFIPEGLK